MCGYQSGWFGRQRPAEARQLVKRGEEIRAEERKELADVLAALANAITNGNNEVIKGLNNLGKALAASR